MSAQVRPGYKLTEVGVIPEDWGLDKLGGIATLERGKFSARPRNDPRFFGGDFPFIQTGDITNSNGYVTAYSQTLNESGLKVSKLFPRGTLFFTIAANIGDVAFASFDSACPDSLIGITPEVTIDCIWLYHVLKSQKKIFESLATQNAQLNINLEKLRPYILAIPPKSEQRTIATALSDMDALISGLDQLIGKKRDIKQATMQQLLTGQQRLPGFSGKWEVKRLGELSSFLKGKGLPKSELSLSGADPCIHYGELFTQYPETIGDVISRTNGSRDAFRSIANDVLMPTSDVTPRGLAKASCINIDGVILGGDILVIRSDTKRINGSFLSYVIRHSEDQVLQLVTGSTVFHLYGSDMKRFTFSMPPVPEQTAIATILADMDSELTTLECRCDKARQLKQGMMQELLTGKTRLI